MRLVSSPPAPLSSRGVPRSPHRSAFTLTELMVAVVVLIVVIIGTSQIFGTASRVTGMGQATAAMMTEAAAIERQMREDLAKLTTEGFFAIRCVAVRNDYYRQPPPAGAHKQQLHTPDPGAPLLNPNLPPQAIIRADQLVFFANGVAPMHTFRPAAELLSRAQNLSSRVYYGHAFQMTNALPAEVANTNSQGEPNAFRAYDPTAQLPGSTAFMPPTPWHRSTSVGTGIQVQRNQYGTFGGLGTTGAGNNMFGPVGTGLTINGSQPESRKWLLARQSILLIDDDTHGNADWNLNYKTIWPDNGVDPHVTARSIFIQPGAGPPWGYSREIRNGRLDAAATQLEDIRAWVTHNWMIDPIPPPDYLPLPQNRRPWIGPSNTDQRTIIQGAVYYPRAERRSPGPYRVDQALTNHVIGSACSSFTIDWTYDDGVGRVLDDAGNVIDPDGNPNSGDELWGMQVAPGIEHPWFGLEPDFNNDGISDDQRGVRPFGFWGGGNTIIPTNIESQTVNTATLEDYWAVFGYNTDQPLDPSTGLPWAAPPTVQVAYTPFPSAIRVTMTLHDAEGRLEGGREFQFVIRLPKRNQ